jgi:hypothetical protein
MAKKEVITGGTILGIIILIGAVILISQQLTLLFGILTLLCFIVSVITGIMDYNEGEFEYSKIPLVCTGIFFILFLGFYIIGFGIGGTVLGQASVQTYQAISGAEQQTSNAMNQAIEDTIKTSCENLDNKSCATLKESISMFKTTQDVVDMAEKLKKGIDVIQKINSEK